MSKKFIHITACVSVLFFFTRCSKDLGNYDYVAKNVLTVDSILNGDHNSDRIYRFVYGDSIQIIPQITGTVTGSDLSSFDFRWVVEGDTIAKTKDLQITSDEIGFGKKVGNLYIIDRRENVTYNYNITFEITSDAPRGHFILAENESGQSRLFIKSTIQPAAPIHEVQTIGDVPLGDKPSALRLIRNSGNSSDNYTYSLFTATQEGSTNIMEFLVGDMLPTVLYNTSSIAAGGTTLNPTCLLGNMRSGKTSYILNHGKVHTVSQGLVSPALYADDPLDYDFGEKGLVPCMSLYGYYIAGFDKRNSRFRVFGNNWGTPNSFVKNYDNIIDPTLTSGHAFVGGAETTDGNQIIFTFLTRKDDTLFLFKLTFDDSYEPEKFELLASKQISGLNQASTAFFNSGSNFWYLAIGRTIYTTSYLGLDVQPVFSLPADASGTITQFSFNDDAAANYTRLGIATYNPQSTAEHKGSYYIVNVDTWTVNETHLNSIDRAKAIQIGL